MKVGVIGVGNILLRDEGVGPKVVEFLRKNYVFEPEIEIIDGGTLGLELLHYLENFEKLIIVDIADFGKEAGFIATVKGEDICPLLKPKLSAHHIGVQDLLEVAKFMEILPEEVVLVGIQPKSIEVGLDLSEVVAGRINELIDKIITILNSWGIKCVLQSHQR